MASIERTAYPRFQHPLSDDELHARYHLSEAEDDFVRQQTLDESHRLTLLLMLKAQQLLGYVPSFADVPENVVQFLCDQLELPRETPLVSEQDKKALYRHRQSRPRLPQRPLVQSRRPRTCRIGHPAERLHDERSG